MSIVVIAAIVSCNQSENYSSVQDFYVRNGVPMQTYTINGTSRGSFTSPQGTIVSIPANAFVTLGNVAVTGDVTIQFKDIYKKSDMLLSNITTESYDVPLVSGGEFFINAKYNNSDVFLANGKSITVTQPRALTNSLDSAAMQPFSANVSDSGGVIDSSPWYPSANDSIYTTTSNYVYTLTQLNGYTWLNTDHPLSGYVSTELTIHPNEGIASYNTQVFLLLNNISSMVSLSYYPGTGFHYYYAPQGMQCTVVAFGVKDGNLYSSFIPITIGSNQTYNFSLNQTTTAEFKTQLEGLN